MTYFNGGMHGWNDALGYHAPEPITEIYGDACAHRGAVPMNLAKPYGQQHWSSGFKWAPWDGGDCHKCGRPTLECSREWRDSPERAELRAAARVTG